MLKGRPRDDLIVDERGCELLNHRVLRDVAILRCARVQRERQRVGFNHARRVGQPTVPCLSSSSDRGEVRCRLGGPCRPPVTVGGDTRCRSGVVPPSVDAYVSDASAVCVHRCRAWSHLAQQLLHPAQPQPRSTCRPEYAASCPRYAPRQGVVAGLLGHQLCRSRKEAPSAAAYSPARGVGTPCIGGSVEAACMLPPCERWRDS